MGGDAGMGGNWYDLAVPLILLVIMICMGMELSFANFRRVARMPRAVFVGLFGQMVLLPVVGLAFAHWPGFSPEIAIGVVIISACPGGATSNIFCYLARGNLALSVALTTISSMLCFATIPLWIHLGLSLFGGAMAVEGETLRLPIGRTVVQLFVVTLLPVVIGMSIRARWPAASARWSIPLRRSMAVLMAASLTIIVGSEWENVARHLRSAAGAALILVSFMLAAAFALARASRIGERDAFTISIEVGLQNGALATMIVVTLLGRDELIVFPGTYAFLSFFPVVLWTLVVRSRFEA